MERGWWRTVMNWLAVLIMIGLMLTCWINKKVQDVFLWYANLIFFFSLSALFFSQIDWGRRLKERDKELYLLVGGCLLAVINLFLAHSNVGAIFTIVDFLLMLYLADKVSLSRKMVGSLVTVCMAVTLYWLFYKRAAYDSVDFNSNGASRIVYTAMAFGLYGCCWLSGNGAENRKRVWDVAFFAVQAVILWQAVRLDARGTMLGVIAALVVYYILPKRKWSVYVVLACTLLFPLGYLMIWKTGTLDALMLAGKRIMSGRDTIWSTFGVLYMEHPIIGIGSDFERLVPQLYYKEVHHALLDLLFVHGGSVFLFVLYFLAKRFKELFGVSGKIERSSRAAMALSILYGMIVIGTFENYYIVAPCSTVFFLILVLEHQKPERNGEVVEQEGK